MKEDIKQIIKFAKDNGYTILIPTNYKDNEIVYSAIISFKEKHINFWKIEN